MKGSTFLLAVAIFYLSACRREYASGWGQYSGLYDRNQAYESYLDESDSDTVVVAGIPYYRQMACDSFEKITDTTVYMSNGDSLRYIFNYYCTNELRATPELFPIGPCRFHLQENYITNYGLKLDAYKNNQLFFTRSFLKNDFNGVIDKQYLKNNVLAGAEYFAYNEKHNVSVIKVYLAQSPGGTNWFAEAYLLINDAGKVISKGLVDYPHHCQNPLSISLNQDFLLTCSEIVDIKVAEKVNHDGCVVMTQFINDSLYSIIYSITKDSLLCDTLVYYKNDTLRSADYATKPDTINMNAFILHVNGDTMARFQFNGFFDYGEGFHAEYDELRKQNLIAFYDFKKKMVHSFDIENKVAHYKYNLKFLKKIKPTTTNNYFQFSGYYENGKPAFLKLYINERKRIIGYSAEFTNP